MKRSCCTRFSGMFHRRYTACYVGFWRNGRLVSVGTNDALPHCLSEKVFHRRPAQDMKWMLSGTFHCHSREVNQTILDGTGLLSFPLSKFPVGVAKRRGQCPFFPRKTVLNVTIRFPATGSLL